MDTLSNLYTPPVDLPALTVAHDAAVMIRRARVADVQRLYDMINFYAARGEMLPRTLDSLYNRVREFQVAEADGEVVACAALKIIWHDLAEIINMVVHPDFQGRSLGRYLVDAMADEALALNIANICTLTNQPSFFSHLGFREVPHAHLHQRIWQDCELCCKRDVCDEVAMIRASRWE